MTEAQSILQNLWIWYVESDRETIPVRLFDRMAEEVRGIGEDREVETVQVGVHVAHIWNMSEGDCTFVAFSEADLFSQLAEHAVENWYRVEDEVGPLPEGMNDRSVAEVYLQTRASLLYGESYRIDYIEQDLPSEKLKEVTVWVAEVEHEYGSSVMLSLTALDVWEQLLSWVEEYWGDLPEEAGDLDYPDIENMPDEQAIVELKERVDDYFSFQGRLAEEGLSSFRESYEVFVQKVR